MVEYPFCLVCRLYFRKPQIAIYRRASGGSGVDHGGMFKGQRISLQKANIEFIIDGITGDVKFPGRFKLLCVILRL